MPNQMTASGIDLGMPEEARLLSEWLVSGKPELGWRGDPRLELHIGVISAKQNGMYHGRFFFKDDIIRLVFEVRRHNEDGTDTSLLAVPLKDWHTVIGKLIAMDPRTPGHTPVMDMVEAESAKMEKEKSQAFQEAYGEMKEHMWNVARTHFEGESFFAMGDTKNKQR